MALMFAHEYTATVKEQISYLQTISLALLTSIDVLPSKNQALCEYCTHVSKLKHC